MALTPWSPADSPTICPPFVPRWCGRFIRRLSTPNCSSGWLRGSRLPTRPAGADHKVTG
jgi:hypothetical protein